MASYGFVCLIMFFCVAFVLSVAAGIGSETAEAAADVEAYRNQTDPTSGEEQTEDIAFKNVIAEIKQSVETGSSLKKAFEKHRKVFSDFFLGMIEAGETGGKLATALDMSAMYLEKRTELNQKVKSAFVYPIVVGIVCVIVVICLLIFVVPMFSKLYQRLHVPLPGPTQVLMSLSFLLKDFWWGIII